VDTISFIALDARISYLLKSSFSTTRDRGALPDTEKVLAPERSISTGFSTVLFILMECLRLTPNPVQVSNLVLVEEVVGLQSQIIKNRRAKDD
jgi:hypothetical protein